MVDSSGLENRYSSKQRTIEGSNPSLSFCLMNRFLSLLLFPGFLIKNLNINNLILIKGNGSAGWNSRARKKYIRYKMS